MNFMVPVALAGVGGAWHDEQVDELFASLLGRRLGAAPEGEDGGQAEEAREEGVGLGGLRVF